MIQNIIEAGAKIAKDVAPYLKDQFFKTVEKFGIWISTVDWEKKIDTFFSEHLPPDIPENVKITKVEKELIDKTNLFEIAKQNIVPNSNEVLAIFNDKGKNAYYLYLAYSKDKEMLPQEENNFIIIKAEAVSKDLQSLFEGHELIILK